VQACIDAGGFDHLYVNRHYFDGLAEFGAPWGCRLWLADPDDEDAPHDPAIHQYGITQIPGIIGAVDLDWCADDTAANQQAAPIPEPDPAPVPEPTNPQEVPTVDVASQITLPQVANGGTGPAVQACQALVTLRGYPIEVDGQFGPITESSVRAFQSDHGLAVDGIVGPQTWAAMVTTR